MIKKELRISKELKELAFDVRGEKSNQIRDKQEYHFQKFMFLKKLNNAINESKKDEKNI